MIFTGIKLHTSSGLTGNRKSRSKFDKRTTFSKPVNGGAIGKQPPMKKALPMPLDQLLSIPDLSICNVAITPECIQTLYNFTAGTTAAKDNELGIFEDLGDVYAQEDLDRKPDEDRVHFWVLIFS